MVVLFFAIAKKDSKYITREFLDFLKKSILKTGGDKKDVIGLEVLQGLKLAWKHERINNQLS